MIKICVVCTAGKIAPHLNVGSDLAAHAHEGFHDDAAFKADRPKRITYRAPGETACPRKPAVGLSNMQVAQHVASSVNRLDEAVFLDIHVESIQHNANVVRAHIVNELPTFAGGIDQITLKSVEYLHTQRDPEVLCHRGNSAHLKNRPIPVPRLVDRCGVVDGPVRIQPAADKTDIRQFHLLKYLSKVFDAGFDFFRVIGSAAEFFGRAISGGQVDAFVQRGAPQL